MRWLPGSQGIPPRPATMLLRCSGKLRGRVLHPRAVLGSWFWRSMQGGRVQVVRGGPGVSGPGVLGDLHQGGRGPRSEWVQVARSPQIGRDSGGPGPCPMQHGSVTLQLQICRCRLSPRGPGRSGGPVWSRSPSAEGKLGDDGYFLYFCSAEVA